MIELPELKSDKKIIVFAGAGINSTFLLKSAKEKYGEDSIVSVFGYFHKDFSKDKQYISRLLKKVNKINDYIGIKNRVILYSYEDFKVGVDNFLDDYHRMSQFESFEKICNVSAEYAFIGTDLLSHQVKMIGDTNQTFEYFSKKHPEKCEAIREEVAIHPHFQRIYESSFLRNVIDLKDTRIRFPLRKMKKKEITNYMSKELIDLTYSCTERHHEEHCGKCVGCLRRKYAVT